MFIQFLLLGIIFLLLMLGLVFKPGTHIHVIMNNIKKHNFL